MRLRQITCLALEMCNCKLDIISTGWVFEGVQALSRLEKLHLNLSKNNIGSYACRIEPQKNTLASAGQQVAGERPTQDMMKAG